MILARSEEILVNRDQVKEDWILGSFLSLQKDHLPEKKRSSPNG